MYRNYRNFEVSQILLMHVYKGLGTFYTMSTDVHFCDLFWSYFSKTTAPQKYFLLKYLYFVDMQVPPPPCVFEI